MRVRACSLPEGSTGGTPSSMDVEGQMRTKAAPMKDDDSATSEVIAIKVGLSLKNVEKLVIEATLRYTDNNMSRCAAILRIDRSTLYAKLKEYRVK